MTSTIKLIDLHIIATRTRRTIENVIQTLLEASHNKIFSVISDSVSLFWDRTGWSVNKLTDDCDVIEHYFPEEELNKAIDQFLELALFDPIGNTNEK